MLHTFTKIKLTVDWDKNLVEILFCCFINLIRLVNMKIAKHKKNQWDYGEALVNFPVAIAIKHYQKQ